ncbi:MAG: TrmH family RNA methyltransferase [Erysipelotrichaceae bacterium]
MLITSLSNNKIKELVKLKQTKYRRLSKSFLIEEDHLISEAHKAGIIKEIILLDKCVCGYLDYPIITVSAEVMKKLSFNISLNKMMAVCNFLEFDNEFIGNIVALDRVQDPSNVGGILRSCLALGYNNILLSDDCVDLYNEKLIKASQGAIFHLRVLHCNLKEKLLELKNEGYQLLTTNLNSNNSITDLQVRNKFILVVGNEGSGVSNDIINLSDNDFKIELVNQFDSLNVLAATSICLYVLKN